MAGDEADPEIELTGARRSAQWVTCGLLGGTAAVATLGILFGRVEVLGPVGTQLHCNGKANDFPQLSCGYERLPSTSHSLLDVGTGPLAMVLVAAALGLALVGMRGGRRGVIAGIGGMVVAVLAFLAVNRVAWGAFFSFLGDDWCAVALYALVAMLFAGLFVLILTPLLGAAERKHRLRGA